MCKEEALAPKISLINVPESAPNGNNMRCCMKRQQKNARVQLCARVQCSRCVLQVLLEGGDFGQEFLWRGIVLRKLKFTKNKKKIKFNSIRRILLEYIFK